MGECRNGGIILFPKGSRNWNTICIENKLYKGKGNVTLRLSKKFMTTHPLIKHPATKTYGEWRYSSTHSLTSAADGGGWSASRSGHFTPRERTPGTHWIGGLVGPRAVLNAMVKRKIPAPPPGIEP
jgi:hypothetical protein